MIEHLVGRQGQPRGAQLHAMQCIERPEGLSQDASLPSPHLRAGSGGEGISLENPECLRPSKGKQLFPLFLQLLRLGSFSFAVAKDFATPLLSQYFPSHYSITAMNFDFSILESQNH